MSRANAFGAVATVIMLFVTLLFMIDETSRLSARVDALEAQLEMTAEKVIELHCLWGGEVEEDCAQEPDQ